MIGDLLKIAEKIAQLYMNHHPDEFAARALALRAARETRSVAVGDADGLK